MAISVSSHCYFRFQESGSFNQISKCHLMTDIKQLCHELKYCSHSHPIAIPYLVNCSIMLHVVWVFLTMIFCSNNFFLTLICCRTNKQLLPIAGKPVLSSWKTIVSHALIIIQCLSELVQLP